MMLVALLLARKGRGKRRAFRRYIRGNVDEELQLGTLAARTLVSQLFDEAVEERTLISSLVATYTLDQFTSAAGTGPLMVGVAHSDYTDAEIEAVVENTASWSEGDKVSQEIAKRLVRVVGTFGSEGGAGPTLKHTLRDGEKIRTKLNWILTTGQSLRVWVYNLGNAAIATTDPQVHVEGHANLWPR